MATGASDGSHLRQEQRLIMLNRVLYESDTAYSGSSVDEMRLRKVGKEPTDIIETGLVTSLKDKDKRQYSVEIYNFRITDVIFLRFIVDSHGCYMEPQIIDGNGLKDHDIGNGYLDTCLMSAFSEHWYAGHLVGAI